MPTVSTIACIVLVAALLVAEAKGHATFKALTKIPASLAFIATAVFHGALDGTGFDKLVVLGLVLGAVGDAALLSQEKKPFMAGIAAFLLSHVAYIAAFIALGLAWLGATGGLVVLVPVAVLIRRWIGDRAGELARAVTAYVIVITAMVACAVGAIALEPNLQRGVLVAAAVLFFVSDICVARDRFVAPGMPNRYLGLPLYYGAQLLFAWSVSLA